MLQETPIKSTCAYCGVGCGVLIRTGADGKSIVTGDPEHPANFGRLCSKGSALHETLGLEGRLLNPKVDGRRTNWDTALDLVAQKFRDTIDRYGPESVAFYVSGQCLTEDYYVANKLMKGFIGSANIDTNSRLCMSSSVAGHVRGFGEDIVPGSYDDLEEADLLVMVGSNAAWCHPVLYQRMMAARDTRGNKMVVIDPRGTATSDTSDLHLALKPGTDATLFNGLLVWLADSEALDSDYINAHVEGFTEALDAARSSAPDVQTVADICGLHAGSVARFYRMFEKTEKAVTLYSQGINQSSSGTDKVNAILNCHFATGRVGKPGMGPFSLTGQPNAMGGREVGGLANMLAAHMKLGDPLHTKLVGSFWRAPNVATKPGLKAVELFEAVAEGKVKALWIMATNPAVSMPKADKVAEALAKCEFLVVSDVLKETDTTKHADVLLPALAWGEKDGTVTNSERRISRQRSFLPAPGQAKPDWWMLAQVAKRMGYGDAFDYRAPVQIFKEHAALSGYANRGTRAFDISALSDMSDFEYEILEPVQWPICQVTKTGTERLLADGKFFTDSGKATAVPVNPVGPIEKPSADYPLILNTGRVRDHWHTMTRTSKSARLASHITEPYVELSPKDASRYGLVEGCLAEVKSQHGRIVVRVKLSDTQQEGCVFVPMHWNGPYASDGRVDALVSGETDPVSGQPELKQTAVTVAAFEAAWYGFALSVEDIDLSEADYWVKTSADGFTWYEIAGCAELTDLPAFAKTLIAKEEEEWISFVDASKGSGRFATLRDGKLSSCLFVSASHELVERTWLREMMLQSLEAEDRLSLLAGRPSSGTSAGPTICTCFGVGMNTIIEAIQAQGLQTVDAIGGALSAGTNCGSCKPELQKLLQQAEARVVATKAA